jgi:hypothetical protein
MATILKMVIPQDERTVNLIVLTHLMPDTPITNRAATHITVFHICCAKLTTPSARTNLI